MKVAYIHVLPLEYYPPARNMLEHMSTLSKLDVRAWTTCNRRGHSDWSSPSVVIRRPWHAPPRSRLPVRLTGYVSWHVRTAAEIAAWNPDVVVSVEPHSSLAVWIYYRVFRGNARLFIHHHEFYSSEDYDGPGMKLLRRTRNLEHRDLLPRAEWISQTNEDRLRFFQELHPEIRGEIVHVLPNYPPSAWIRKAIKSAEVREQGPTRIIYVGSASIEDTFISEAAAWVANNPAELSLHVVGDNIAPRTWDVLASLQASNITLDRQGIGYEDLPHLLSSYDVGLVLYRANTLNFAYNLPNKVFEYLAAGLEVWYPPKMVALRHFQTANPALPLREIDFLNLSKMLPPRVSNIGPNSQSVFSSENALAPFIEKLLSGRQA